MRCGWGSKAGWLIPFVDKRVAVWVASNTVWFLVNTCHSERFRDEYASDKAIYKCPVLIHGSMLWSGRPSSEKWRACFVREFYGIEQEAQRDALCHSKRVVNEGGRPVSYTCDGRITLTNLSSCLIASLAYCSYIDTIIV